MSKVQMFMQQDNCVTQNTHEVIEMGIRNMQKTHNSTLFNINQAKLEAEAKAKEDKVKEVHRK